MIPANRRRNQRNKLQQQRSRNGKQWEEDLCEELNAAPNSWARCWPKAWAGQPFDISAMVQGAALGIECKAVQRGNLPFSALRPNENENLSRFEDAGGAALIAVRRTEPPTVAFIPWCRVRGPILAGDRGSVPLGNMPHTIPQALEEYRLPCPEVLP